MCLLQSGVSCVQLNGSMSLAARDAAIKRFTEDPDCKIFLMSLKAGGVALNLTVASHVSNPILILSVFWYSSVWNFKLTNTLVIYVFCSIFKRLTSNLHRSYFYLKMKIVVLKFACN